jgi:hypothetical protein
MAFLAFSPRRRRARKTDDAGAPLPLVASQPEVRHPTSRHVAHGLVGHNIF